MMLLLLLLLAGLGRQRAVRDTKASLRPSVVYLRARRVGGRTAASLSVGMGIHRNTPGQLHNAASNAMPSDRSDEARYVYPHQYLSLSSGVMAARNRSQCRVRSWRSSVGGFGTISAASRALKPDAGCALHGMSHTCHAVADRERRVSADEMRAPISRRKRRPARLSACLTACPRALVARGCLGGGSAIIAGDQDSWVSSRRPG